MLDLFEGCGLIYQIQEYVSFLLRYKFSAKMRTTPNFLDKYEQEWDNTFTNLDWNLFFEEHKIEALTEQIKANIKDLFDRLLEPIESELKPSGYIKGIDEYLNWMLYFDAILSFFLYFHDSESRKTEVFKQLLTYYQFLRSEVEARGSLIPEPWNRTPLERFSENEQEEIARVRELEKQKQEVASRGPCPNCGEQGRQIMSYGIQWHCKSCGRRWLKNPRHKK